MQTLATRIAENLARVRERMACAAARAGRDAAEITLLAVTKYAGLAEIRALAEAGCREWGESRPQQLWQRAETLADLSPRWHLIGHLQRNKVRRTLPLVALIHSVDSLRLVAALDEAAGGLSQFSFDENGTVPFGRADACPPLLLEVNVSGEPAKGGLAAADVGPLLERVPQYGRVRVRGLMCMAGLEGDAARRDFAALRTLRDRLRPNCPDGLTLDELSMGMSGDYEVAIEEGSTLVRIGSALFEGCGR
ncbi:MAG: YggS family pyridoxal phosphate-dependent enzyme [Thermoguttaceae bacterium]|jgi:pyridoxal phosphate enzyme (YggS family)